MADYFRDQERDRERRDRYGRTQDHDYDFGRRFAGDTNREHMDERSRQWRGPDDDFQGYIDRGEDPDYASDYTGDVYRRDEAWRGTGRHGDRGREGERFQGANYGYSRGRQEERHERGQWDEPRERRLAEPPRAPRLSEARPQRYSGPAQRGGDPGQPAGRWGQRGNEQRAFGQGAPRRQGELRPADFEPRDRPVWPSQRRQGEAAGWQGREDEGQWQGREFGRREDRPRETPFGGPYEGRFAEQPAGRNFEQRRFQGARDYDSSWGSSLGGAGQPPHDWERRANPEPRGAPGMHVGSQAHPGGEHWFDDWGQQRNQFGGREGAQQPRLSGAPAQRGPFSGVGPRSYQRSPERVRDDVCERLSQHGQLDASDITVEAAGPGEITLRGSVDSRWAKRQAEEAAESVFGVQHVNNELRVRTQDRR